LASTSLDRFFRVHSTIPPDSQSDTKGLVVDKLYTKSIPTAVIWDPTYDDHAHLPHDEDEDDGDKVWEEMQDVDDSDGDETTVNNSSRNK
jgi:ribosome biogenesis protein NSA1